MAVVLVHGIRLGKGGQRGHVFVCVCVRAWKVHTPCLIETKARGSLQALDVHVLYVCCVPPGSHQAGSAATSELPQSHTKSLEEKRVKNSEKLS